MRSWWDGCACTHTDTQADRQADRVGCCTDHRQALGFTLCLHVHLGRQCVVGASSLPADFWLLHHSSACADTVLWSHHPHLHVYCFRAGCALGGGGSIRAHHPEGLLPVHYCWSPAVAAAGSPQSVALSWPVLLQSAVGLHSVAVLLQITSDFWMCKPPERYNATLSSPIAEAQDEQPIENSQPSENSSQLSKHQAHKSRKAHPTLPIVTEKQQRRSPWPEKTAICKCIQITSMARREGGLGSLLLLHWTTATRRG